MAPKKVIGYWLLVIGFLIIHHSSFITVYAQAPVPPPQSAAGVKQLQDMVERVIGVSVGLAFFFMTAYLVWSGFKFITSGGEAKAVADAWRVFTWALMGIMFLVMAWLTLLLIKNFTGVDVTHFCFGFPGGSATGQNWLNGCPP